MKKEVIICSINVNNKKYTYTIEKIHDEASYIECIDAGVATECLNEQIPNLIFSLPALILEKKENLCAKEEVIRFRVTKEEKIFIEKKALEMGFKTVSSFLKYLVRMT